MFDYLKTRLRSGLLAYAFAKRFGRRAAAHSQDDFDWKKYHLHYRGELEESKTQWAQILAPGDYAFTGGELARRNAKLPLHPNHRLLYETLLQLSPASAVEVGCGGGDHLANFATLAPGVRLHGRDLSDSQLLFLRQRHPHLQAELQQLDVTQPGAAGNLKVDLAYTQAVVMHIQTANSHIEALRNIARMATRYIVLMENWEAHPFLDDLKGLAAGGALPWREANYYFRRSPELGNKPHLLVVSGTTLPYERLSDYRVMLP